jgi:hypothetical protein
MSTVSEKLVPKEEKNLTRTALCVTISKKATRKEL